MGAKFKWLLVKTALKCPEFFQGLQFSSNFIGRNRLTNETGVDRPHSIKKIKIITKIAHWPLVMF